MQVLLVRQEWNPREWALFELIAEAWVGIDNCFTYVYDTVFFF